MSESNVAERLLDLARRLEAEHWGGVALGWANDQEACEVAAEALGALGAENAALRAVLESLVTAVDDSRAYEHSDELADALDAATAFLAALTPTETLETEP